METRNDTHNHLLLITRILARSAHVVLAASWLTLLFLFLFLFFLTPSIRTLQYITTATRISLSGTDRYKSANNNVPPMRETKNWPATLPMSPPFVEVDRNCSRV